MSATIELKDGSKVPTLLLNAVIEILKRLRQEDDTAFYHLGLYVKKYKDDNELPKFENYLPSITACLNAHLIDKDMTIPKDVLKVLKLTMRVDGVHGKIFPLQEDIIAG